MNPDADNLEDIYELTPMQQGMLFHLHKEPESGAYFEQFTATLNGNLDTAAFQQAWQQVVNRHTALRTSFHWEGMETPMQVVFREVELPFTVHDWQHQFLSQEAVDAAFDKLLNTDRETGFVLSEAPLMRVQLCRISPTQTKLVWSFLHLLLDGWCLGLLFQEIVQSYEAITRGLPLNTTPGRPYRDFVQWLSEHPAHLSQATWTSYLDGMPGPSPLPFETTPQQHAESTVQYDEQMLSFTSESTQSLQAFASEHGLTLNTILRFAWALLLARSTGKSEVTFGATVSGRPSDLPGAESMVGLFINTIPCRIQLATHLEVIPLLQSLQETQARLSAHEHCSLAEIQGWSPLEKSQALFESILVFENYPANPETKDTDAFSLNVENLQARERTNYPLTLVIAPEKSIGIKIIYDTTRWSAQAIKKILTLFETLSLKLVEEAQSKVSNISGVDAQDWNMLESWNAAIPQAQTDALLVHERVSENAQRQPEAIALRFGNQSITYRELDQRSNQLANALFQHGAHSETFIAVCLERSPETVIAQLAILKTGAAFLPIDSSYPPERMDYMLKDAKCSILLTHQALGSKHLDFSGTVILLDAANTIWESEATTAPAAYTEPANAAYCIYTSGSTGSPKGVVVTHQNLLNLIDWHNDAFCVTRSSVATHLAGSGFDASVWELWPYLAAGATVLPISKETLADIFKLPTWLNQEAVTHSFIPTPILEELLTQPWPETTLEYVLTGGDRLQSFPDTSVPFKLINNYGPTEYTVVATSGEVQKAVPAPSAPSIGQAIAQSQTWILGDTLDVLPVGSIGELYLSGMSLARGYLGRSDLSAERFIPNPFGEIAGDRLYKTGDLARYLESGKIEFIGRADNQVKLRGHRIEIHEIELQLLSVCPDAQVVVKLCHPNGQEPYLAAYFVASHNVAIDFESVKEKIQQQLPDYMVPVFWVQLEQFPLTANGKVDRNALPTPDRVPEAEQHVQTSAQSPEQQIIASIMASVLQVPAVGIHDNFFHLGGHSLLAMQLISRLRESLDEAIPLQAIFDAPTVASLTEWMATQSKSHNLPTRPAIEKLANRERFPLSFSQERLWLLSQMPTDKEAYHITLALRLTGALERKAIHASLNRLLMRHDVLRTAFVAEHDQPEQKVIASDSVFLNERDISALTSEEQFQKLTNFVHEEANKPFFLENGTLIRATAFTLSTEETALILTVHHIVVDGWSIDILARDWFACYRAVITGADPDLPDLPIQYGDYAHWQRQWLQGAVLEQQLDYWKIALADLPVLELPTDFPRPARKTYAGRTTTFQLSPEVSQSLKHYSQEANATVSMTLLAAYALLLHRYSGQDDFALGMPIAGREGPETENLIGFFVNTLVIRSQYTAETTFEDLLAQIRQRSLAAYAHRDLPFEKLVEVLNPERDLSQSPLFQVMFTFQNTPKQTLETHGLIVDSYDIDSGTAKFDLTLTLLETDNVLSGSLEYNCDLFQAKTIGNFIDQLTYLLSILPEIDTVPLAQLPLLSPRQSAQLNSFNETDYAYAPATCLPALLETQVAKTPDAIALKFKDETLTYTEFNTRCNQLAHHLQRNGVQAETRVAVFLERSIEMVVALHAIGKAGGAYVPIDPSYPKARIAYMLKDCQASVVLTHSQYTEQLSPSTSKIITLDTLVDSLANEGSDNPACNTTPDNLAYIIYTSGSTGNPKGAMNTHRAIYNRLQWMQQTFALDATDRVLQKTPFSFDVSVWEFFWPTMTGATLLVAEPEKHKDGRYLTQQIDAGTITTLHFVPSMLKAFLNEIQPEANTSLKRIICSGEALSYDLQEQCHTLLPHVELHNLYGPTEAAVDVTHWPALSLRTADKKVPIGKAITNTSIHILDTHLNPTPAGVPGELYIGGVQLARGYWNRPELTAEKFIPNPFSNNTSSLLYRTGDAARYLEDGSIEYLGRLDFQVKVRGFRVELGEIEAALKAVESIQDSAVIASEDAQGYGRLVAYLVAKPFQTLDTTLIRTTLSTQLPDYMVPTLFMVIDSLPLSPNGKLDRRALPEPTETIAPTADFIEPRTPIEAVMARIWSDVLNAERVGATSNFFELGGHSLLATQILARVREIFRIEVSMLTLFEAPQLDSFTERVVAQSDNADFIEKIAQAWIKLQSMTPKEKEQLRKHKEGIQSKI